MVAGRCAIQIHLLTYLLIALFSAIIDSHIYCRVCCLFAELRTQFAQFDKDNDGRITREEFVGVMTSLGHTVDADKVGSMLTAADTDSKKFQCS